MRRSSLTAHLAVAGLLAVAAIAGLRPLATGETPPPSPFAAVGREIVETVRRDFLDARRAARWAQANAGYAEGIETEEAFARETRRRLAELATSHTSYYRPDDLGHHELLSIFAPVLEQPAEVTSLGFHPVDLGQAGGAWHVGRVFAGGPAAKAGLSRGDRVEALDGEPFHPRRSLAGKAGETVTLTVRRRPDEPARAVTATPREIDPAEEWLEAQKAGTRIVERAGRKIAYVPMWSCAGERYLAALREAVAGPLKDADALVVDFRGGWGGCNPELVALFDPAVPALERIDREGERSLYLPTWRKPLVVLVDRGTRSGKEMVSRALQRHGRATLVGEPTAGAVVAGRPYLLSDGSLLFLAVEDVRVDGERLEGTGVTPDVEVAAPLPWAGGDDPQLDRALEVAAAAVAS
jgi:carboxyl-terminal processing protease